MITINLPSQLRTFTNGQKAVKVQAATFGEAIHRLDDISPMIRPQVFDATGAIRRFVGVFVNNEQVAEMEQSAEPIADGSTITIVMAVAGG